MLKTGDTVNHPLFPEWGKGIITKIFNDGSTTSDVAIVLWIRDGARVHHMLNRLQPYGDC